MRPRKSIAVGLFLGFVLASLLVPTPWVHAQANAFSAAAIQAWKQSITAAGFMGAPRYTTAALPTCTTNNNRGALAYDTTVSSLKVCSGSAWGTVGGGGAASITMNDDVALAFGTAADNTTPAIMYNTTQTVDTGMLLTGTVSNNWVIAENQDKAFDFAHAQATDPTVFIHSHNQSTTQFLSLAHNGSHAQLSTGATGFGFNFASGPGGVFVHFAGTGAVATGIRLGSARTMSWSSQADPTGASGDTFLYRDNAAVIEMGADVNGAAVAQTFKAHDGITGTDIAGANLTLAGGRGTGAGTASDLILSTGTALSTGTTAQTLVTRVHVEGGTKTLTDATASTVFTVTTGNDLSCGGTMFFTVEAADAANQQTTSGAVNFSAADNAAGAGGEACAAAVTGTNAAAATSGTLTVTADATTGTDLCNIRLTATGSLTETVGPRVRYSIVFNPTSSSCAITPQ